MKINRVFSKSLFLITTDGWIRKKQMDKKPCFYDAVLAPQVRKQSVWLVWEWPPLSSAEWTPLSSWERFLFRDGNEYQNDIRIFVLRYSNIFEYSFLHLSKIKLFIILNLINSVLYYPKYSVVNKFNYATRAWEILNKKSSKNTRNIEIRLFIVNCIFRFNN